MDDESMAEADARMTSCWQQIGEVLRAHKCSLNAIPSPISSKDGMTITGFGAKVVLKAFPPDWTPDEGAPRVD